MKAYDYIIIGAGIMGLSYAYSLLQKDRKLKVAILEKEDNVAKHASGKNSGVIHAGIYYANNSRKLRFCLEGSKLLKEFCFANNIPINQCGKLIVAKNEHELPELLNLYSRAVKNQAPISLVDEREVKNIDKNVVTYQKAIWSPNTASIPPYTVCEKLKCLLIRKGVKFFFNTKIVDINTNDGYIRSREEKLSFFTLVNCAGLYADKIANLFGIAKNYRILPFKGYYLVNKSPNLFLRTNVYPVPNKNYPFLGVHFTVTQSGQVKIGPTAVPALWREQYKGLRNFSIKEMFDIGFWYLKSYLHNDFSFRQLVYQESKYLFWKNLIKDAEKMLNQRLNRKMFKLSAPGIRAQLYDVVEKKLVNDFVFEKTNNSIHVLNAVSPAFTSSFAISDYLVERYHG